jgi:hypothetical protein
MTLFVCGSSSEDAGPAAKYGGAVIKDAPGRTEGSTCGRPSQKQIRTDENCKIVHMRGKLPTTEAHGTHLANTQLYTYTFIKSPACDNCDTRWPCSQTLHEDEVEIAQ